MKQVKLAHNVIDIYERLSSGDKRISQFDTELLIDEIIDQAEEELNDDSPEKSQQTIRKIDQVHTFISSTVKELSACNSKSITTIDRHLNATGAYCVDTVSSLPGWPSVVWQRLCAIVIG
jgi:hypothetical protein